MDFTYNCGGKTYIQRPLVLGQVRQLLDAMRDIAIPAQVDAAGLISVFGERLPDLMAVVLTERGQSPKDKDLKETADFLSFGMTPEEALQVIDDFFVCNPIPSLLERIGGLVEGVVKQLTGGGGSKNSSASSPEGMSPVVTTSSGDAA